MSIAEIKEEAKKMKAGDVRHLAACFHHLSRRSEAGYTDGLDQTWETMEKGDKVSLTELNDFLGGPCRAGSAGCAP